MINKSKGNMYKFITHTWNPIKGKCLHDCTYCYMKSIPQYSKPLFIESEMTTPLNGKSIFIGSTTDVFANNIPSEWIDKLLNHCMEEYDKRKLPIVPIAKQKSQTVFWNLSIIQL